VGAIYQLGALTRRKRGYRLAAGQFGWLMGDVMDCEKWEKLWNAYIVALSYVDRPLKGANARLAWARLGKAERAIANYDPAFYQSVILGRK